METAAALHRDIPVIPVLVQDKAMPHADELPTEIEALAWRNAFEIRHNRWDVDVAELVKALEKIVSPRTTSATTKAAISTSPSAPSDETQATPLLFSWNKRFFSSRWVLLTVFIAIAGSGVFLLVHPLAPERQTFPEPMYDEYRLDACYEWGTRCGEEPASRISAKIRVLSARSIFLQKQWEIVE